MALTELGGAAHVYEPGGLLHQPVGLLTSLPACFAAGNSALAQYRGLVYFGLPMGYHNTYVNQVGAVTAKQVAAAARKHLDPSGARIIVVGDAKALEIPHQPGEAGAKGTDVPVTKGDAQVALLDALKDLLASGDIGKGDLVMLDADRKVVDAKKARASSRWPRAPSGG